MVTDTVADLINRIKTASASGKTCISVPFSKAKFSIGKLLEKESLLVSVDKKGKKTNKSIDIMLMYKDGVPAVKKVKRISKLGRRVYYKTSDIKPIKNGRGLLVLSTPEGVLSGKEAWKKKVGGEALFTIE